jgi:hypothetical protein
MDNSQYIMCEQCIDCGGNPLSMSTVNPNASVNQSVCCTDGGASSVSATLNAIGRWGTALTGVLQGKPVATNKSGVAVGARGAQTLGAGTMSPNAMLLILVIVGVLIFMATRH